MTRRAYVYFALTLLLGFSIGAWAMFSYGWYFGLWHRGFDEERVVQHLKRDLNLSDTQAVQVEKIVGEYKQKWRDLRKQFEPQFNALREERRNRMRQILTPEQVEKFNDLVRRSNERMKREHFGP